MLDWWPEMILSFTFFQLVGYYFFLYLNISKNFYRSHRSTCLLLKIKEIKMSFKIPYWGSLSHLKKKNVYCVRVLTSSLYKTTDCGNRQSLSYLQNIERFSIEFRKPKPKWSQRPIRVKEIIRGSQWQLEVNACNRPVARENASDQGAIGFSLHLIGWEGGASFLDQSNSTVKQNQFNPGLLSTLNWKLL